MISPVPNAARITLVDPTTASQAIAAAFKSIPNINVFRALANAETLFPAYMEYVTLLFKPMELDSALERMIVLHVAEVSQCLYAWRQNVIVAKSVGVSQAQLDALELGDLSAHCFRDDQKAAFRFADEVMQLIENHKLWGLGIGWIDAHLIASSLLSHCVFWTHDGRLNKAAAGARVKVY